MHMDLTLSLGLGLGSSVLSRVFNTLDPSLTSYYTINNTIAFSGDFEIELDFATSQTGGAGMLLIGDDHANSIYVRTDPAGTIKVWLDGAGYIFSVGTYTDGELHNLIIRQTGTSMVLILDGVSTSAQAVVPYTGGNDFFIGSWTNATDKYFDGVIANVKLTDHVTSVVTTFGLDTATGTSESSDEGNNSVTYVNVSESNRHEFTFIAGEWIGNEELWTAGAGVSDGTEGTFSVLVTNPSSQTDAGVTYRVVTTVTGLTAGAVQTTLKGAGWSYSANGIYTETRIASSGSDVVRTANSQPNSGASALPSFKRILQVAT
jgi:hypothetical protein